ncbi:bifunctional diguanylate cyclase/phosphodiesterase [Lysobacter sp. A3-1-A15]|uniref:bifunctional diguanylate cyclase/phosphodiesterase n=1 Tax=Novilysobacter viscosus TaxID=3098602 RepID=UPI002ED9C8C1
MDTSKDSDGFASRPLEAEGARVAPLGVPAGVWSLLALVLGVVLTLWAVQAQQRQDEAERRVAFTHLADRAHAAVLDRLRACEMLARSVQTMFLTSEEVTADEFRAMYANLDPRTLVPGMQALVVARRETRADGDHYVYHADFVQPRAGNEALFGLDVNTQPANLAAVLASRDSNRPALSAPFRLAQVAADGGAADGVTFRLPIYSPGQPPGSVAERRERIRGSLAISFQLHSLIQTALPEDGASHLHVEITDVTGPEPLALFDSHTGAHADAPTAHRYDKELRYGGRAWRLSMHPLGHDAQTAFWQRSPLLPGLLASALLALLVSSVVNTRRRAVDLGNRMSRRYRESEERFRALNELLPALVVLARQDTGRITYANQASRLRLGEEVCELELPTLFEDEGLRERILACDQSSCLNMEAVLRSANGDRFWASLSIARVDVGGESKLLMVASDISEQRQLTELLSYQASHDALTELYNRREFERRVERALIVTAAGGAPAALLYIDLDQFKLINDTSGHIAGDQLLIQLAINMREQLRGGDVLARLGGDEFGVLATNVHDQAGASNVAERLRERIDGYVFVWEQRTYTISASIGAVMIDHPNVNLKDLLAQADTACYMAKESGRNRVHFYSAQDDDTTRRQTEMEWANRLRWAVEEGRLLLKYQEVWPLAAPSNGKPHIELLLRFRDEQGRLVPPGAFMPAAERYGLMPMIDRWVVETALSNFDRLHPSGPDLQLATINLSGASIEDDALATLVLDLIEQHGIDPGRVCFEITETVAVRHLSQVSRFIERLRAAGCLIALDDFGAGMSSFGYLKNLPVDIIKIDGSFIRDILVDPMSHAIVGAVTDIGHRLGLKVIAEWVSSEEIAQELHDMGVDYAQGYVLHKPEPVVFHRGLTGDGD